MVYIAWGFYTLSTFIWNEDVQEKRLLVRHCEDPKIQTMF